MSLTRIAFVELLGGIGDLLMALPAMRALAFSHPDAKLSVLTFRPGGELLDGDPQIAEVRYAKRTNEASGNKTEPLASVERFLRHRHFDVVVTDTCYGAVDGAVERCSASLRVTRLWHGAREDESIESLFLRNLADLGLIESRLRHLPAWLHLADADRAWAAAWWQKQGQVPSAMVLLNASAGMPIKQWPEERLAAVGRELAGRGWKIGVVETDDGPSADRVAQNVPGAIVVPKLPLRRFAAVCTGAALFVSPDTGPARIAAAVGVPVIGIYGPTVASRYGIRGNAINLMSPFDCRERRPLNFTLQPCWYSGQCVYADKVNCCEDVSVRAVLDAADQILTGCNHGCPGARRLEAWAYA